MTHGHSQDKHFISGEKKKKGNEIQEIGLFHFKTFRFFLFVFLIPNFFRDLDLITMKLKNLLNFAFYYSQDRSTQVILIGWNGLPSKDAITGYDEE